MLNVTKDASGSIVATLPDGSPPTIYNPGDLAWVLASTALVMIMTPGLGFFYSGLLRRKNALSMIFLSMAVYAVVSFQWFFWGYSLAFAPNASRFIGTLTNFGFMDVDMQPSIGGTSVPSLAYAVFQMMFATVCSYLTDWLTSTAPIYWALAGQSLPRLQQKFNKNSERLHQNFMLASR